MGFRGYEEVDARRLNKFYINKEREGCKGCKRIIFDDESDLESDLEEIAWVDSIGGKNLSNLCGVGGA